MSNKHRQRIVGAIGLLVASVGILLRFVIFQNWSWKYLSLIATFGKSESYMLRYTDEFPFDVFTTIAMAFFYAGIVLMVAAVIAWLFMTPETTTDEADAT